MSSGQVFVVANVLIMEYIIAYMNCTNPNYVLFEPAWRLIAAVLEDRCRFSDVSQFQRHLRFKRIFATPVATGLVWFTERPTKLVEAKGNSSWLIGVPCHESPVATSPSFSAAGTALGASADLHGQRLLICGNQRLLSALAPLNAPLVLKSVWDVQTAWKVHHRQVEKYLPAFGDDCEVAFRAADAAYTAISTCISAEPEVYLGYLQKLSHALLLFVGIRAHRGELY